MFGFHVRRDKAALFQWARYRVEARDNLGSAVARAHPYRPRARGRVRIRRPALSLAECDCREDHRSTLVGSPVFWREPAGACILIAAAFNITTSMGRLTLNRLVSFA